MFLIGDLIRVKGKWSLYHYYVYVGPLGPNGEDLFHMDTQQGGQLVFRSVLDSEEDVYIVSRVYGYQSPDAIRTRALLLVGTPYHATRLNCEHGASCVQTGNVNSPQLNFLVLVALAAIAIQAFKLSSVRGNGATPVRIYDFSIGPLPASLSF